MKIKSDWNPESTPTFWINHASRLIMRSFERELRPLGFGMAYLPVVMALEESGPMLQKDLLQRARIEQPTMAALLARMERDGVIARKPDPIDSRARRISLTAKGRSRLGAARRVMSEVVDVALAGIDARERAALMSVLRRLVTNLSEIGDEHAGARIRP
ncbi:MarR family winged helix-turn-helix transcriptional regulator [Bradyrhizobium roseum]|uniref:MarR family winged helix-turn-helix transcriptional regulator n=1 Tax=Bradyrhizobium roseum TaxID=3056648 RepID=UPI0026186E35|nr:MarR family transcriptional regulator [Bradyrhizobium roseus]WKA29507.1 MarR family transcriptional regulator [Bradyrhizobium roseus]